MHDLEPFYHWREYYKAEEDEQSPFYGKEYSEMYFSHAIYDHVIHPQWDFFGSPTLYLKLLYVNYDEGVAVLEMMGEWNDAIHNDIMFLKREIIDGLTDIGIQKFILIGENVLNFHGDIEDYYEEWFEDIDNGWIAGINFQEHVRKELSAFKIDYYFNYGGELDILAWRTANPLQLVAKIEQILAHRLH